MVYEIQNSAIYRVESFGCTASTMKQFTEQLQTVINQTAVEGWLLHSFQVINGDICVVVFCKEQK